MSVYEFHQSNDPATFFLEFFHHGKSIGRFEVPIEFWADNLAYELKPDPFRLLESLIEHLAAYDIGDIIAAHNVQRTLREDRTEVMRIWLQERLTATVNEREAARNRLDLLADEEAQIRSELQSLPVQTALPM